MMPTCLILTSEYPPLVLGGVGRYVHEVAHRLRRHLRVAVMVVPTYQPGDEDRDGAAAADDDGLAVALAGNDYRQALAAITSATDAGALAGLGTAADAIADRCLRMLVDAPVDDTPVIYVQDYALSPVAAALRARLPGARVVAACHLPVYAGFTYFDKPIADAIHQVLEARLVHLAQRVVVPSAFAAHVLGLTHNVSRAKLAVIPLGAERPEPSKPMPTLPLRLLAVGRATEQKGHHFLLQALKGLLAHHDVQLTIAAGATGRARLGVMAGRLGVAAHIRFEEALTLDAMWALYDSHHVLVTTSLYETFGLAVLEAMASGRPTVGFAVGALPALWGPDLAGAFGTPVADVAALVARLQALFADERALAALGARAECRARSFGWARHVDALLEVLQPRHVVKRDAQEPAWG